MANYNEALSEISGYPKALSHAGSGGGFALKSISFTNATEDIAVIYGCINAEGKYINPVGDNISDDDYIKVSAGETVTVYYAEPSTVSEWLIDVGAMNTIVLQFNASGITADGTELHITAEAPDGAKVAIETDSGGN